MLRILFLTLVCTLAAHAADTPAAQAMALIARVVPGHEKSFTCEVIPAEDGKDVFEIDSAGGKIALRGNNGVSLASAFNWYLKYNAKCDFSDCGSQLDLPAQLPLVGGKFRQVATVPHRFMFNYCTFGYTMPWWNWERWQRELDWMAMNGINMPFILTGQEAVWIKTFTQYGYTEQEIRQWLGSPAYFPWTFMQNMHSSGGELPAEWTPQRVKLAQQILNRARDLGMHPVLQGYYGMVLPEFAKRHPDAKVLPQGRWVNAHTGPPRPDMLNPTDPLFAKIAATFMAEQEKLFGRVGYFTADPFHEGGNSSGVDMRDCGIRTLEAMKAQNPDAVWVKMCWGTDNAALLSGIPDDRVIALDLRAEATPFWPNGAFKGKQWIWCLLHNFGGNTELATNLPQLAKVFPESLANPSKGKLVGLAFTPEGHCNSPVVYDLLPEFAWRKEPVDLEPWITDYARRRYGAASPEAHRAWDGLLSTVAGIDYHRSQSPTNSLAEARPLRGELARTWGNTRHNHNTGKLAAAWRDLIAAAPACSASDAYRFDLADITRQVMGDLARPTYERAMVAYAAKDDAAFDNYSALFLKTVTDCDTITGTRPEFLLGKWIADARAWGANAAAKDLHERQARLLITSWDGSAGGELNDYACRQWNGLLKDYYRVRWEMYFKDLAESLKSGKPVDNNAFLTKLAAFEKSWVDGHNVYPAKPAGDTLAIARRLADEYRSVIDDFYPQPVTPNKEAVIGCWQYNAQGGTHLREFRADGSVRAMAIDGSPHNWLDGFQWRIEGDRILAENKDRGITIIHALQKDGSLHFESEGFGSAKRVALPGKVSK